MTASRGKHRQGYHHGNLREALVNAARKLIAERGPVGFNLAEAARQAGVSSAAPYRHFADRDALIAEVRQRGFAELGRRLTAAWRRPGSNADTAFRHMGKAYLTFAREEPGYYGAMFATGIGRKSQHPSRRGQGAFDTLEAAIARLMVGTEERRGIPRALAYQVWALLHGIATLSAAGLLSSVGATSPGKLLRAGVAALLRGIGGTGAGADPRLADGRSMARKTPPRSRQQKTSKRR